MESKKQNIYCVKCKKKTGNGKTYIEMSKNGRKMLKGKCKICGIIKSQFTK